MPRGGGTALPGGPSLPRDGRTVVREPPVVVALVWLLFPPLGAGAGWLLKLGVAWVASLRWAPAHGAFKLVASIDEPAATIGALALGALAGLTLAHLAAQERLTVTVTDRAVTLARAGAERQVERARIGGSFREGRELVLLGPDTAELARESSDLPEDRLRDAFVRHGYRWWDGGGPYRDRYRRWVEGVPGLPPGADPLFRARQRALRKGERADAADLRGELGRLGVVVRDEQDRQYWRRTDPAPD